MWFKIHNTEVKISFTFPGLLLLSLISESSVVYFFTFLSSLIHELIHILFILIFKSHITHFSLYLLGARIKRQDCYELSFIKEAVISYSAPVFNVLIGLWMLRSSEKAEAFAVVNIFLGLFNLLPFYTFDGGRGLSYLLRYMFSERVTECVVTITSVITVVIFSFLSVHIFFNYNRNYTLLIFVLYMIFCLVFRHKEGIF